MIIANINCLGFFYCFVENLEFNPALVSLYELLVAVLILLECLGISVHRVVDLLSIATENLFVELNNFLSELLIVAAHSITPGVIKRR